MTYRLTALPLYADPVFSYSVSLEGQNIELRFYTNTRQNRYHFDVVADDGSIILEGLPLLPNTPIGDKYDLSEFGLTGYFYLGLFNQDVDFSALSSTSLVDYCYFLYINEVTE